MNQRTLNGEFTLTGKGLHTGLEITARFLPAPENHGYKIKRVDLGGRRIINRCTCRKCGGHQPWHRDSQG